MQFQGKSEVISLFSLLASNIKYFNLHYIIIVVQALPIIFNSCTLKIYAKYIPTPMFLYIFSSDFFQISRCYLEIKWLLHMNWSWNDFIT